MLNVPFITKIYVAFMSVLLPTVMTLTGVTANMPNYSAQMNDPDYTGLAEVYEDYFPIGTAVYSHLLQDPARRELLKRNFNSLTFEFELKQPVINPEEGVWNFEGADAVADFARENGMTVRGHTLLWGDQDCWMIYDESSASGYASAELFFERLYDFMEVVITRYDDVIDVWDVVNEPFYFYVWETYKPTKVFELYGEQFLVKAFQFARELAEPGDKLFVNETKVLNNVQKSYNLLNTVKRLLKEGVPIDGIGLQGHLDTVSIQETPARLQSIIDDIRDMGLEVQITELDMRVYVSNNQESYDTLPLWVAQWQQNKYKEIFAVLRKNSDVVTSVTFWGMDDGVSACLYSGRNDWPLLIDKDLKPKASFFAVCDF